MELKAKELQQKIAVCCADLRSKHPYVNSSHTVSGKVVSYFARKHNLEFKLIYKIINGKV